MNRKFSSWVLLFGGLVLIGAAAVQGYRTNRFVEHASASRGKVSRLIAGGSHPEISFQTASGETIEYAQGGLIFGFSQGQAVDVLYEPADAKGTATIRSFGALWGETGLLTFLGLAVLAWGLSTLFMNSPPIGSFVRGR
jgi:hypothetical protein